MVVLMTQRLWVRVMLLGATVAVLLTQATELGRAQSSPVQTIEIRAERFSFTPSQIRVEAGTILELRVRSDDTNHGFRIIGTDVNLLVPKRGRGTATVRFMADTPGEYVFECSKLCGAGHSFMRGEIIVAAPAQAVAATGAQGSGLGTEGPITHTGRRP